MAYVDLTARFTYNIETVFGDFSKLANNDKFMKENGWQDGTIGVFFQAAAPTGWTKLSTVNARALRVVSGSGGGFGGSTDPASTITLAHTHTISTDGTHIHVLQAHDAFLATSGTDQATGAAVNPIMAQAAASFNFPAKTLALRILAGATTEQTKKNQMAMTGGPYSSGSGGSHNHSGATPSDLSDVTLAYANVILCSKDTSTGYTDLSATFVHNVRHVADYLSQLAANDAFNYARRTPAGTVSLFCSAAAPTGWTKATSVNGSVLRAVSGTGGGTGGTSDVAAQSIGLAHNHTSPLVADGSHTHSMPAHTHELGDANAIFAIPGNPVVLSGGQLRQSATTSSVTVKLSYTGLDGSGTSSSSGNHNHAIGSALTTISLAYLNIIQASKDTVGAPTSYTDYTAFFVDQNLLAYQELAGMANSDAYLYYHTMPAAAVMFFFQASAPLNWTKLTTRNDMLLRVVSDTTGSAVGGSWGVGSTIPLAHTHTLDAQSHSHTLAHTHELADGTSTGSGGSLITNTRVFAAHGAEMYRDTIGGAGDTSLGDVTESTTVSTDTVSHNHGGATGSALTDLSLAYADVIQAQKN